MIILDKTSIKYGRVKKSLPGPWRETGFFYIISPNTLKMLFSCKLFV